MSRRKSSVPSYRLHRPSGQARVIVDGKHIYLGKFGSPESREKYARIIADLDANNGGENCPTELGDARLPLTINELILQYWQFAKGYYVKDGTPQ